VRDPDGSVASGPADRPVASGDHLTGRAPQQLVLLSAEQVVLLAEEPVEHPGRAVGAAEMAQDHGRRPRPVDGAVGLPHGLFKPAFDLRTPVVEGLGRPRAAANAVDGLEQSIDGRIGHLMAVQRALGRLTERELTMGPDITGVELLRCLEHRHAPPLPTSQDGPVE